MKPEAPLLVLDSCRLCQRIKLMTLIHQQKLIVISKIKQPPCLQIGNLKLRGWKAIRSYLEPGCKWSSGSNTELEAGAWIEDFYPRLTQGVKYYYKLHFSPSIFANLPLNVDLPITAERDYLQNLIKEASLKLKQLVTEAKSSEVVTVTKTDVLLYPDLDLLYKVSQICGLTVAPNLRTYVSTIGKWFALNSAAV